MRKLAFTMMRKDKQSTIAYMIVMTVTIAINFIFTSASNVNLLTETMNNSDAAIQVNTLNSYMQAFSRVPASNYLNFIIVLVCCFLMFYVNSNYIFNKQKEMIILTVSGASTTQIVTYFLYQTALLFLIASIPGILLGYFGVNFFFSYVASIMHTSVATLDSTSLIQTLILIAVILVYLIFHVIAYIYHFNIKDSLMSKNAYRIINTPPYTYVPSFLFFVLFIGACCMMPFFTSDYLTLEMLMFLIGLFGTINGFLSKIILWFKSKTHNRYLLISLSNVNATLLTNRATIFITIASISLLYLLGLSFSSSTNERILAIAGCIISTILMSLAMYYDLILQAKQRKDYYLNLWKIGYTRKDLYKILLQEFIFLYKILIFYPLIIMVGFGYRQIHLNLVQPVVVYSLILFFIFFMTATGIMTYLQYRNIMNKTIIHEK